MTTYIDARDLDVMVYVLSYTRDEEGKFPVVVHLSNKRDRHGQSRPFQVVYTNLSLEGIDAICEDPVKMTLGG